MSRRHLIELMQDINFGRIEGLRVREADPVFDPAPAIVREIKFGSDNGPRPELNASDFALKQRVVELFAIFDQLQNGIMDVLEVKNGLPFRVIVTERAA